MILQSQPDSVKLGYQLFLQTIIEYEKPSLALD